METRDNNWLTNRFNEIYNKYFYDVEIKNQIIISFGRPCRTRLGSIKLNPKKAEKISKITINGFFKNPEIPEFVVDAVIAHEFMHYAHGFASNHDKAYKHPHRGGVVDWDLIERGLGDTLKLEKLWVKKNWQNYLKDNCTTKPRKRRKNRKFFGIRFI
jgi:hypothetical protein